MAWSRNTIVAAVTICIAFVIALTACSNSDSQLKTSMVNQNVEYAETISAHSTIRDINTRVDGCVFVGELRGDTREATLSLSFSIDEADTRGFNLTLENCSIRSINCDYRNGLSNPWGETPYWTLYGTQGQSSKCRLHVGDAANTFLGVSDKMKTVPSGGGTGTLLVDISFDSEARFDLYLENHNESYAEGVDHVGFVLSK